MLIYYVTLKIMARLCLLPRFHMSQLLSLQHTVLFAISLVYHEFVHMLLSRLKYSSLLISVFSIFTFFIKNFPKLSR